MCWAGFRAGSLARGDRVAGHAPLVHLVVGRVGVLRDGGGDAEEGGLRPEDAVVLILRESREAAAV